MSNKPVIVYIKIIGLDYPPTPFATHQNKLPLADIERGYGIFNVKIPGPDGVYLLPTDGDRSCTYPGGFQDGATIELEGTLYPYIAELQKVSSMMQNSTTTNHIPPSIIPIIPLNKFQSFFKRLCRLV